MSYIIDSRILAESVPLFETKVGTVRLRNEARWPWCLVIPNTEKIEYHQLEPSHRHALMDLVSTVAAAIAACELVTKVNLASFGNMVSQQHWHVIGRWPTDPLWPESVIGAEVEPMPADLLKKRTEQIREFTESLNARGA